MGAVNPTSTYYEAYLVHAPTAGWTFNYASELNLTGLQIQIRRYTGTSITWTHTYDLDSIMDEYVISLSNADTQSSLRRVGTNYIRINFVDYDVVYTHSFTVNKPALSSISVSGYTTSFNVGSTFALGTGFQCLGHYSYQGTEVCTEAITSYSVSTAIGYEFTHSDITTAKTITITYSGKTETYSIQVIGMQSIYCQGANISFSSSENFSLGDNFKVYKQYSNGTVVEATSGNYTITGAPQIGANVGTDDFTYRISVTEGGFTATEDVDVTVYDSSDVNDIVSIAVQDATTLFNYGGAFTFGAGKVIATLTNNTTQEITSGYTLSVETGTILNRTSSLVVTVSYLRFTTTYTINIKYLYSIQVTSGTYTSSFYTGDNFAFGSNFAMTKTYRNTDGTTADSTVAIASPLTNCTFNYSTSTKLTSSGTKTVQASYTENGQVITTTYSISVVQTTLTGISVSTAAMSNAIAGELLFYEDYTNLTKCSKLVVTASYNNGSTSTLAVTDYSISSSELNTGNTTFASTGTKAVTVTYGGKTATYNVTVQAHSVSSIVLTTTNVKTTFKVGDTFNANNLIVKAVYVSGYEALVDSADYTLSTLINTEFETTDYGTRTITVAYSGKSATYDISIIYPTAESLVIDTSALDLQPMNNSVFDKSLITAKMVYDNGYEETLEFTPNISATAGQFLVDASSLNLDAEYKITITGCDFSEKSIVVTGYDKFDVTKTKSATFDIVVSPDKQLQTIYIDGTNAKKKYKTGEVFTGEGFVIKASYQDVIGWASINVTSDNANISTANPALGETLYTAGQYTVRFTYFYKSTGKEATYTIIVEPSYSKVSNNVKTLKVVHRDSIVKDEVTLTNVYGLYDINDTMVTSGVRGIKPNVLNPKCYGYIELGSQSENVTIDNGKVILFEDYKPPVEGVPNISVEFPHYVDGYADRINHCRFGILFGCNNDRNRLFVSGNTQESLSNMDWHSEPITISQIGNNYKGLSSADLTYFPDLNYCGYGQNSNKVIGYDILGNGKLLVLKTDSKQEKTIYFRTPKLVEAMNADGSIIVDANGNNVYEEAFTLENGSIGEGGLTPFGIANFNGDTVFLTKSGLKGLDITGQIADNQRYANPRSHYIDKKITKEDLENSVVYTFKEYLLIGTSKGVYVANIKYINSDKNYEWWYFDNIVVTTFMEFDDELYFGTKDGGIFKFPFGEQVQDFNDKKRTFIGLGGLLPIVADESNDKITVSSTYADKIINGNYLTIISSEYSNNLYSKIGTFINENTRINLGYSASDYEGIIDTTNGYFKVQAVGNDEISGLTKTQYINQLIYDGRVVYIDNIQYILSTTASVAGEKYYVRTKRANGEELPIYCFLLQRENGDYADLENTEIVRISCTVPNDCMITEREVQANGSVTCKLIGDHNHILDIIKYDNQAMTSFKGAITETEKVKCYYVTKPINFGTNVKNKNILSWTSVNDSDLQSRCDIGYAVNNLSSGYDTVYENVGARALDMENFNFQTLSLLSDRLPHTYTKIKLLTKIDFISFVFRSQEDSNCVLTNLSLVYTFGLNRMGGK